MAQRPVIGNRRPRKSIWLSPDEYNVLAGLKQDYENRVGSTDWGKFLVFIAGAAIGLKLLGELFNQSGEGDG